ncbi:hypothetical protein ILYODFUR_003664 [Ilyodon furcidens]|uniref:Secreted protein n=1 Tax=Ilyodon furcidens TaxID=33524 RepID=A0ABV0VAS9_9TELE
MLVEGNHRERTSKRRILTFLFILLISSCFNKLQARVEVRLRRYAGASVSRLLALLQGAVNLVKGLLDAQRCESGRGVLVPALLHQFNQSRECLRETTWVRGNSTINAFNIPVH